MDTNAAFFTGLSLLVVRKCFADSLPARARALLDEILAGLAVWFGRAAAERTFYYPNKYLGDLVCAHLLGEALGRGPDEALAGAMADAADYWQRNGWGWGEHLSDGYSRVCLDELSVLLMLSEHLSADVRRRYEALLAELLAVGDHFDGGPRVPAVRSYAFDAPPRWANYRDLVRRRAAGEAPPFGNLPAVGHLLDRLGWHGRVPARLARARDLEVACFGGAVATARIEDDVRLGSLSRFPLMPSAEHPTWGLSWQCFPVALWHSQGDWGFCQWEAVERGSIRCHPATDKRSAYLHNALTGEVSPPVVGHTFAVQRGGNLVALRRMPAIPASWEALTDRFRLVGDSAAIERGPSGERWSQWLLRWGNRTVSLCHVDLTASAAPEMKREGGRVDWEVRRAAEDLRGRRGVVGLWAICLAGPIDCPPQLTEAGGIPAVCRVAEERAWELRWPWRDVTWRLRIDPLAGAPLAEVGP